MRSQRITALATCPPASAVTTAQHPLPDLTLPCLGTQGDVVALRTLTGTAGVRYPSVYDRGRGGTQLTERELATLVADSVGVPVPA